MPKSEVKKNNGHGGARKGAGMPKGTKTKRTIEKDQALAEYRQKIMQHAEQIFREQKAMAFGSYELFIVEHYEDQNGKVKKRHVLVEDPATMSAILDDPELTQGDNYVLVRTVEPDKFTLDSMLDRAFGKPTQVVDQTNVNLNHEVEIVIDEDND